MQHKTNYFTFNLVCLNICSYEIIGNNSAYNLASNKTQARLHALFPKGQLNYQVNKALGAQTQCALFERRPNSPFLRNQMSLEMCVHQCN